MLLQEYITNQSFKSSSQMIASIHFTVYFTDSFTTITTLFGVVLLIALIFVLLKFASAANKY